MNLTCAPETTLGKSKRHRVKSDKEKNRENSRAYTIRYGENWCVFRKVYRAQSTRQVRACRRVYFEWVFVYVGDRWKKIQHERTKTQTFCPIKHRAESTWYPSFVRSFVRCAFIQIVFVYERRPCTMYTMQTARRLSATSMHTPSLGPLPLSLSSADVITISSVLPT